MQLLLTASLAVVSTSASRAQEEVHRLAIIVADCNDAAGKPPSSSDAQLFGKFAYPTRHKSQPVLISIPNVFTQKRPGMVEPSMRLGPNMTEANAKEDS